MNDFNLNINLIKNYILPNLEHIGESKTDGTKSEGENPKIIKPSKYEVKLNELTKGSEGEALNKINNLFRNISTNPTEENLTELKSLIDRSIEFIDSEAQKKGAMEEDLYNKISNAVEGLQVFVGQVSKSNKKLSPVANEILTKLDASFIQAEKLPKFIPLSDIIDTTKITVLKSDAPPESDSPSPSASPMFSRRTTPTAPDDSTADKIDSGNVSPKTPKNSARKKSGMLTTIGSIFRRSGSNLQVKKPSIEQTPLEMITEELLAQTSPEIRFQFLLNKTKEFLGPRYSLPESDLTSLEEYVNDPSNAKNFIDLLVHCRDARAKNVELLKTYNPRSENIPGNNHIPDVRKFQEENFDFNEKLIMNNLKNLGDQLAEASGILMNSQTNTDTFMVGILDNFDEAQYRKLKKETNRSSEQTNELRELEKQIEKIAGPSSKFLRYLQNRSIEIEGKYFVPRYTNSNLYNRASWETQSQGNFNRVIEFATISSDTPPKALNTSKATIPLNLTQFIGENPSTKLLKGKPLSEDQIRKLLEGIMDISLADPYKAERLNTQKDVKFSPNIENELGAFLNQDGIDELYKIALSFKKQAEHQMTIKLLELSDIVVVKTQIPYFMGANHPVNPLILSLLENCTQNQSFAVSFKNFLDSAEEARSKNKKLLAQNILPQIDNVHNKKMVDLSVDLFTSLQNIDRNLIKDSDKKVLNGFISEMIESTGFVTNTQFNTNTLNIGLGLIESNSEIKTFKPRFTSSLMNDNFSWDNVETNQNKMFIKGDRILQIKLLDPDTGENILKTIKVPLDLSVLKQFNLDAEQTNILFNELKVICEQSNDRSDFEKLNSPVFSIHYPDLQEAKNKILEMVKGNVGTAKSIFETIFDFKHQVELETSKTFLSLSDTS